MTIRAMAMFASGTLEEVEISESDPLSDLYRTIGHGCDMVELVRFPDDIDLFVDEEGLYRDGAPANPILTLMFMECGLATLMAPGGVLGNGVFATHDDEGELADLSDKQRATLARLHAAASAR